MDIVKLLRKIRFVLAAVKLLVPAQEQAQIRMKTDYMPLKNLAPQNQPIEP
jgi:hypothetical protein